MSPTVGHTLFSEQLIVRRRIGIEISKKKCKIDGEWILNARWTSKTEGSHLGKNKKVCIDILSMYNQFQGWTKNSCQILKYNLGWIIVTPGKALVIRHKTANNNIKIQFDYLIMCNICRLLYNNVQNMQVEKTSLCIVFLRWL